MNYAKYQVCTKPKKNLVELCDQIENVTHFWKKDCKEIKKSNDIMIVHLFEYGYFFVYLIFKFNVKSEVYTFELLQRFAFSKFDKCLSLSNRKFRSNWFDSILLF